MPVDNETTFTRYGYRVEDLNPASAKPIVYTCDVCGEQLERQRRRITQALLCHPCVIRLPHSAETKAKRTAALIKSTGYSSALKNRVICKRAHTNVTPRTPKIYPTPPGVPINEKETQEKYGYSATSISPSSDEYVVFDCAVCVQSISRARKNVDVGATCHSCTAIKLYEIRGKELIEARWKKIVEVHGKSGLRKISRTYGKAEDEVADMISAMGINVTRHVPLGSGKHLDIVLWDQSIAVEYNGLYWHNESSKTPRKKYYHLDKMKEAESIGLTLITIFEDEWLDRKPQIEQVLRAKLNVNITVLNARDCSVVDVDSDTFKMFIHKNHIQRPFRSPAKTWGLVYNDDLVGVLALEHAYHEKDLRNILLNRLCFKGGVRVVGGVGRLLAPAAVWSKQKGFEKIVSWSDKRWSSGNVYASTGFTLALETGPDYKYVSISNPKRLRISKESQQKSNTNCPPELTEEEWALERGLTKIYDCGKKRWELVL